MVNNNGVIVHTTHCLVLGTYIHYIVQEELWLHVILFIVFITMGGCYWYIVYQTSR